MGRLNKLPNGVRYPSHKEWQILKKLPKWWMFGSMVFATPVLQAWWRNHDILSQEVERLSVFLGLLFTFWFFIGALCIGLIVIIIMKGPGYVADPYYLPKEDKALENKTPRQ